MEPVTPSVFNGLNFFLFCVAVNRQNERASLNEYAKLYTGEYLLHKIR